MARRMNEKEWREFKIDSITGAECLYAVCNEFFGTPNDFKVDPNSEGVRTYSLDTSSGRYLFGKA